MAITDEPGVTTTSCSLDGSRPWPDRPELIEYFDNFAFDEVLRHGNLDTRTRLMAQLAAADRLPGARRVPGHARRRPDRRGHPGGGQGDRLPGRALRRHGQGLRLPARHQRRPDRPGHRAAAARPVHHHAGDPAEKGLAVQKQIIGDEPVDRLYATAPADEQHIQRYLSANCFGDHYTRTGIDLATRELLTFVLLVALGGCDPQVKGHVAGNLNVGNDRPADRGRHPAAAVHRLPAHAQRDPRHRRGHPSGRRTETTADEEPT